MSTFTGTSESGRVTYGVNEPAWQVHFVETGILQQFRLFFQTLSTAQTICRCSEETLLVFNGGKCKETRCSFTEAR